MRVCKSDTLLASTCKKVIASRKDSLYDLEGKGIELVPVLRTVDKGHDLASVEAWVVGDVSDLLFRKSMSNDDSISTQATFPTIHPPIGKYQQMRVCGNDSSSVTAYTEGVRELACEILELMAEGLGVPDTWFFSRLIREVDSDSVLRFNHYPPIILNKDCFKDNHNHTKVIGFGEHSDPQILTILRSNDVAGLQISLQDGVWNPVAPDPLAFCVNPYNLAWFHFPEHNTIVQSGHAKRDGLAYSRFYNTYPDPQELAAKLCIPGQGFLLNAEEAPWKQLRKDLTTLAQTWSVLCYSNLAPTSPTSDLNMDRVRLVYGLVMKVDMDVGSIISSQISQMAQSNSSRLGFPALIIALCIARGVVSDSLTFESLSPIINLAYIRKSYWNPNDPTITFPGSRKARARAPSDASTSAPAPTPTLVPALAPPAPADPSMQSTNAIVSMLQSLHHSLCLAPEAGAEAEETPKETPIDTPVEELKEGGATDDDPWWRCHYVADVTTVQRTWDPWPTPAQDTPIPPYDDPTPTQEE
ncbi:Gibberellin 2-beta-dioxygenase 4 [Glycine max]|nr:Gibberellin 2-beta-dioxygenase 4 [Glycine max]